MRIPRPKGLLAAAGALMLFSVGAHAQWSDLGLSGHEVTRLRLRHGFLFACTNDGLHRKVSDTADSSWVLLGFGGQRVHDVLAVSSETLIVAREVTGTGADTVALFRSTDRGLNWHPFQNGLGAGSGASARRVMALLDLPAAPGTVLAAARSGMNKSTDGGLTWKQVSTAGTFRFLVSGSSTLWAGGESFLTPFVRRSTNGGETWTSSFFSGNDGVAFDMAFDPTDPDVAFLGLDDGLRWTVDNGVSWTPVPPAQFGPMFHALGSRGFSPLRLYSVGDAAPGGATLFKSDDSAASWTPISFPTAGSTLEWTILVRSGPAADTLFLGMGSGVLRYVELEVVGIDPPFQYPGIDLRIHPNPSAAATTVTFSLPQSMQVSLRVLDPGGREVTILASGRYDAGQHRLIWHHPRLPSGIYFYELRADDAVASWKALIVR